MNSSSSSSVQQDHQTHLPISYSFLHHGSHHPSYYLSPVISGGQQAAPAANASVISSRTGPSSSNVVTVRGSRKDRHSKILTAQGLRDRRVRLSIGVSRRFFDLQDMLGFDTASNTLAWLIRNSKDSIKKLARAKSSPSGNYNKDSSSNSSGGGDLSFASLDCEMRPGKDKEKKVLRPTARVCGGKIRAKMYGRDLSRAKARARARERTREKSMINCQMDRDLGARAIQGNAMTSRESEFGVVKQLSRRNPSSILGYYREKLVISSTNYGQDGNNLDYKESFFPSLPP